MIRIDRRWQVFGYRYAGDHPKKGKYFFIGRGNQSPNAYNKKLMMCTTALADFLRDNQPQWTGPHILLAHATKEESKERCEALIAFWKTPRALRFQF